MKITMTVTKHVWQGETEEVLAVTTSPKRARKLFKKLLKSIKPGSVDVTCEIFVNPDV
jgi:hypothetical protein